MSRKDEEEVIQDHSLFRLFSQLVARSFEDLQIGDEIIRAYVVDLLVRFARTDSLYQIRDPVGKRIETVVGLLIEADFRSKEMSSRESFRALRHTGDYALFMTGIFRSYVESHGYVDWYMQEGPRSYRRAIQVAPTREDTDILERLWRDFEQVSGGLDYMRKVYFGQAALQFGLDALVRRFDAWN